MLGSQLVHVPRVVLAEDRDQGRVHQMPSETIQKQSFEIIAVHGEESVADAFSAGGRAANTL